MELDSRELIVYRCVVRNPGCGSTELARKLRLSAKVVENCCERLCADGLVVRTVDGAHSVAPTGPEELYERLRAAIDENHHNERLRAAQLRTELTTILGEEVLRSDIGKDADVRVLGSPEARQRHLLELAGHTRREVLRLRSTRDGDSGLAESGTLEQRLAGRGLDVRMIIPPPTALAEPVPELWTREGMLVRAAAIPLPLGMHLFDRRVAVVDTAERTMALTVREEVLIRALHALFEGLWTHGQVLREKSPTVEDSGQEQSTGEGRLLLQLLRDGAKDDQIARRLGVSVRTVGRKVAELLSDLEASSRFQAGVMAARRGWV